MLKAPHALKPWPEVAYPLHQLKHGNKQEPSHSWNNNIGDRHPPGKFTTTIQTGSNNHAPEPRPRVHQNGIVIMQNGGNTQVYGNNNHFYSPRTRRLLRDPYLRNKAKFESRPKLPPILEDANSQDSDHESTASGTFRKNINKKKGRQLKSRSPRSNPSNPPINARRPARDPPRHINSDQWFVPNGYHVDDTTIVIDTDGVESLGPLPTSRTRVNLHRNSNRKKKRRLWICVSVIATFLVLGLAASGVAIYLAARAILNEDSTTEAPPALSLYSIYMRVKLTGAEYNKALQEKISPYYTSLQKDFCDLMKISNEAEIDLRKIYQECSVYKYSPGSVIVHAELRYDRDGSKAIESTTGKTIKNILHLTVIDILANNSRAKTFKNKYAPDTDSIVVSVSKEEKSTTSPTTTTLVVTSSSTSDDVVTTLQSSSYSTSASSAAQTKRHTPIWHTTSAALSTITTGHVKAKTSSPVTSDIGNILSSTQPSVMVSTIRTSTAGQTQVVTSQTPERFTPIETDSVPSTTKSTAKISTAVSSTETSTAVSSTETSTAVSTTEASTATPETSEAPASEGTTMPHIPGGSNITESVKTTVPVTADGTTSAASTIKLSTRPLSTAAPSTTRATVKSSIPSLTTYSSSVTKEQISSSQSVSYVSTTSTINRAPGVTTSMPALSEATVNSTTVLTTATSEISVTISRETSIAVSRATVPPPVSSEGNYSTVTETSPPPGHDVTTATIPSSATFDTTSSPQVVSMRLPAVTADDMVTTNGNQTDGKPGASTTVLPSGNVSDTTTDPGKADGSSQDSNITGAESAATVSPGTGESRSDTPAMGNVNETDHATEPVRNVTEATPPAVGATTTAVTPAGHTENYPGRTRDDGAFVTPNVTSIKQYHTTTAFITAGINTNKTVVQHTTSSGTFSTENLDNSVLTEGITVNEVNQSTAATTVGFTSTEHSDNYTANTANSVTMSSGLTPLTSGSTTSEPTTASSVYSTTRTLTDGRTTKSVIENTTAAVSETVTKEMENITTSHGSGVGEKTKASTDTIAKTEAGIPAFAAKTGGTTAAMGRTTKAVPLISNDETTPVLQDVTETTEGSGQPVTP